MGGPECSREAEAGSLQNNAPKREQERVALAAPPRPTSNTSHAALVAALASHCATYIRKKKSAEENNKDQLVLEYGAFLGVKSSRSNFDSLQS